MSTITISLDFEDRKLPEIGVSQTIPEMSNSSMQSQIEKSNPNRAKKPQPVYSNSEAKARAGIAEGRKCLIVLRGPAGSGKSFLANQLKGDAGVICNTDDYFTTLSDQYEFDASKLNDSHVWNQQNAIRAMESKVSPVIIDNTNCFAWEMVPYVRAGKRNGYDIHILIPNNAWIFDAEACSKLNHHKISVQKIENFLRVFKTITVTDFDDMSKLKRPQHLKNKNRSSESLPSENAINTTERKTLTDFSVKSEKTSIASRFEHNLEKWPSDDENTWGVLDDEESEKSVENEVKTEVDETLQSEVSESSASKVVNQTLSTPKPATVPKSKLGLLPALYKTDMLANNRWTLSNDLICGPENSTALNPIENSSSLKITLYNKFMQVSETSIALAYTSTAEYSSERELAPLDHVETITVDSVYRTSGCTSLQSCIQHDKSSQTDFIENEQEETTLQQDISIECTAPENKSIESLKNCFPDVPRDDLEHVLKNCDFDLQWATNVLLDSGYCISVNWAPEIPECGNDEKSQPCTSMELSIDMASQLQQLFGKLEDDMPAELFNPQKLQIHLNMDLAFQIYQAWLNTQTLPDMNSPNEEVCQFKDEGLLEMEKHEQTLRDEQFARHLIDNETQLLNNAIHTQAHSLSTKIKMKMLTDMFSDIDKPVLHELFKANHFNLEQTVALVCESLNRPIERVKTNSAADKLSYPPLARNTTEDKLSIESEDFGNLNYDTLRQRALFHYETRTKYFQQAQEAFHKKMLPVSSYYAQMGRLHDAKFKEANHLAAQKIVNYRKIHDPPDTIDLHGLHVQEAVSALAERLKEIEHRPGKLLNIVTGSGKHSQTGPKIKPAVLAYLSRRMYKFYEMNSGMIQVTI